MGWNANSFPLCVFDRSLESGISLHDVSPFTPMTSSEPRRVFDVDPGPVSRVKRQRRSQ